MEYLSKLISSKQEFSAHGYSRVMQILFGQVPKIHTFGIISAENPMGESISGEENRNRIKKFKEFLRFGHFGYVQHKGKYGNFENPFLIANINRKSLNEWASPERLNQEAYIFGIVNQYEIRFQFIVAGVVKDERKTILTDIGDRNDLYSEYKGRRFYIPFFDDTQEIMQGGARVPASASVLSTNLHNPNKISYTILELEPRHGVKEIVADILRLEPRIHGYTAGKLDGYGIWGCRGQIKVAFKKLQQVLEKNG